MMPPSRPPSPVLARAAHDKGAAAVEFALILPGLMALLVGVIDWSLYMYERLNVGVVANKSMRLAAGDEDPAAAALATFCGDLPAYSMACADGTVAAAMTDEASGQVLKLTVSLPFEPPVGLIPTPERLATNVTSSCYWQAE